MNETIETAAGTISVGIRVRNSMRLLGLLRRMETTFIPVADLRSGDILVTNRYVGNIRSAFVVDEIHRTSSKKHPAVYSVRCYEFSKKAISPFTSTRYTFTEGDIVLTLTKK